VITRVVEKRLRKSQKRGVITRVMRLFGLSRDYYYKIQSCEKKGFKSAEKVIELVKRERLIMLKEGVENCITG